jgi:2-dehydro-3-deoxygluconokinase
MSSSKLDLLGLGECMVEFSRLPSGTWRQGFAGDVMNTMTAATRLGLRAGFITTVGNDPFTEPMIAEWRAEGIDIKDVGRDESRPNGAYFIQTDAAGERTFSYLRSGSAATTTLERMSAAALIRSIKRTRIFYFSGISLAVMGRVDSLRAALRKRGKTRVAFDPNWRPALWPDRKTFARTVLRVLPLVDVFFPSLEDCEVLFPKRPVQDVIAELSRLGITTIVKGGTGGAWFMDSDNVVHLPAVVMTAVDTTGAGDAFNAGVLAAMEGEMAVIDAVDLGQRVAAIVVSERGAIVTSPRGRAKLARVSRSVR